MSHIELIRVPALGIMSYQLKSLCCVHPHYILIWIVTQCI